MKYYRIGTKDDALAYYVYAPSVPVALKTLDAMIGGINQNALQIREYVERPKGLLPPTGAEPQVLEPSEEDEE
jgi:hypothetical protein